MTANNADCPEKSDHGEHEALFGAPPLFDGDQNTHDRLLAEVRKAVVPADIFEQIWVDDIVYLSVEVLGLRRLKKDLMTANAYQGVIETLTPLLGRSQAETLGEGWAARKSDVVEEVNKTVTSASLSTDSILAQTFSLKLDQIEQIEHMLAVAETRRNATIREIERHRQTLGRRLRQVAQQIEQGEYQVIETSHDKSMGAV